MNLRRSVPTLSESRAILSETKLSRTDIGCTLAISILSLLYFQCHAFIYFCANCAVIYDVCYMLVYGIRNIAILFLFISMMIFNSGVLRLYRIYPLFVLKIIIIAQMADVYQYIVGTYIGRTKIGWISKNKTYEGYLVGLFMTILSFIYFCPFKEICLVYFLGIFGGLCSSLIKRKLEIKDYSNLLGPHGGYTDRVDSIVFPMLIFGGLRYLGLY